MPFQGDKVPVCLIVEDPNGPIGKKSTPLNPLKKVGERSGKRYRAACTNGIPPHQTSLAIAVTCQKCIESPDFKETVRKQEPEKYKVLYPEESEPVAVVSETPANPQ